jgi:uncharacterized protein YndB with AHSA1/START domain
MAITEEMHIDCPPATAFDLMADVRKLTDWNQGASRAEMTSAGPIGQGSRFVAVNRGQEMESTITRFDRPERLDFSVTGKAMDVSAVFRFTAAGAGTTLFIEFQPHPKGIMKILFPVLRPLVRRDLAKQHLKFRDFCQSHTQSHNQ